MDKIEELIKYHNESEYLDFKRQEYKDPKKPHLLKDVLAFANSEYVGDRYIIIGIKKDQDGVQVHEVEKPLDAANIQQYILANITPDLNITYEPYIYEGTSIIILTIKSPTDRPYLMKRTHKIDDKIFLKEGEIVIRKGSFQLAATRADLDKIYKQRQEQAGLEGKVTLTFANDSDTCNIASVKNIQLPSDTEKATIEAAISKKKEQGDASDVMIRQLQRGGILSIHDMTSIPYLETQLREVKKHFRTEDEYYLYEERSGRLDPVITNNGHANLKGVLIEMRIPKTEGLIIPERIPKKPGIDGLTSEFFQNQRPYPKVRYEGEEIVITEEHATIRHLVPHRAFKEPLRVFADEKITGQLIKAVVEVHSENLKRPERFEICLSIT